MTPEPITEERIREILREELDAWWQRIWPDLRTIVAEEVQSSVRDPYDD